MHTASDRIKDALSSHDIVACTGAVIMCVWLCYSCVCRYPELISGVVLVAPAVTTDSRGFLARADIGQLLRCVNTHTHTHTHTHTRARARAHTHRHHAAYAAQGQRQFVRDWLQEGKHKHIQIAGLCVRACVSCTGTVLNGTAWHRHWVFIHHRVTHMCESKYRYCKCVVQVRAHKAHPRLRHSGSDVRAAVYS